MSTTTKLTIKILLLNRGNVEGRRVTFWLPIWTLILCLLWKSSKYENHITIFTTALRVKMDNYLRKRLCLGCVIPLPSIVRRILLL